MTIEYKDSKRIVGLSTDTSPDVSFTTNIQNNANGWAETGSQYTITSGQVDYVSKRDGSDHFVNYDLQDSSALSGSNLSETQFVVRWHMKNTGNTTDGYTVTDYLAVRSDDGTSGQSQDYFAFRLEHGNVNTLTPIVGNGADLENPTTVGSAVSSIVSATMDHYFEIKRTSATSVTFGIYSDSTYSTLVNEQTLTVSSSYTALRYFSMITRNSSTRGSTMTGVLDTVKIYNAVSSIESKPTDIQDNSILIQKDTARRYWRSGEVSGSDTNTSQSTYNDISGIGNFDGGWGLRINAGHALVGQEIRSIKVRMRSTGTVNTTNMTARLYGSTKATLRATSTAISSSGLPSSFTDYTFVFPSGSRGVVQAGDHLLIVADALVASGSWNCQIKSGAGTNTHFTTWQEQSNAFTEQTTRELWYDPIVSGTFTPATWTMQPTLQDNFSSTSGWTQNDSAKIGLDTSNDKLDFNIVITTNDNAYRSIPTGSTTWVMRYLLRFSTISTSSGSNIYFLTDISDDGTTEGNNSATGSIGLYMNADESSNNSLDLYGNGATSDEIFVPVVNTDYYVEVIKTSATTATATIGTDSYGGTTGGGSGSITGLTASTAQDTFAVRNRGTSSGSSGHSIIGYIKNFQYYNGVTSV